MTGLLALIVRQAAPFALRAVSDTIRKPKGEVVKFSRVSRKLAWSSMGAALSGLLIPVLGAPSPDLVNVVASALLAVTDLSGEAADGWATLGATVLQGIVPAALGMVMGYRTLEPKANVAE